MTMPHERTRALVQAGELMQDMLLRDDVPEDLRKQLRVVLRHYPDARIVQVMAKSAQAAGSTWLGMEPPSP